LAGDAEGVADLLPGRSGRSGGNNLFAANAFEFALAFGQHAQS
jgi:hypothetical protein